MISRVIIWLCKKFDIPVVKRMKYTIDLDTKKERIMFHIGNTEYHTVVEKMVAVE